MSWLLAFSYWIHLAATIIWLGGIALLVLFAWPALQRGTLAANQWFSFQRPFLLWANASWIVLLVTGFYQMTSDPNYTGFLSFDSQWALAILAKHLAFIVMVALTVYMQAILHPAMARIALLAEKKPELAAKQRESVQKREILLLRLNLFSAVIVLFFTAVATAI